MKPRKSSVVLVTLVTSLLFIAGCSKKPVAAPPPPPPPPPAPTASLSANPDSIQAGQSTQLTWQTQNATDINIDGVGPVEANGSKTVSPSSSTTYRLTAKGAGGTQEATARVTVTEAPAPPPQVTETEEQMFARSVQDVFFDYDSYALRSESQQQLAGAAQFLNQRSNLNFTVEGHCDERGSTEYNLALGDKRAGAVKDALVRNGVAANRIKTITYGKEKPFCTESNEQCWQQNRRGHFVLQK
ncbi:MAG TPA: peptidoglycan-associated lipoprotein Pal [Terriglobales bacterium]|nr:peptidoglycan-associated lipoprotein Pal [Terriglobales bacterium]